MKKKTHQPKLQLGKIKVASLSAPQNHVAKERTLPTTYIIICGWPGTSWTCVCN